MPQTDSEWVKSIFVNGSAGPNELTISIHGKDGDVLSYSSAHFTIEAGPPELSWDILQSDLQAGRWSAFHQHTSAALFLGDRDLISLRPSRVGSGQSNAVAGAAMLAVFPPDAGDEEEGVPRLVQMHVLVRRDAAKDTAFTQPFIDRGVTVHWWEPPAGSPAGGGGGGGGAFLDALRNFAGGDDAPAGAAGDWALFAVGGVAAHPALAAAGPDALAEATRMGLRLAVADGLLCLGTCGGAQVRVAAGARRPPTACACAREAPQDPGSRPLSRALSSARHVYTCRTISVCAFALPNLDG